jgi:hypothetical protein
MTGVVAQTADTATGFSGQFLTEFGLQSRIWIRDLGESDFLGIRGRFPGDGQPGRLSGD